MTASSPPPPAQQMKIYQQRHPKKCLITISSPKVDMTHLLHNHRYLIIIIVQSFIIINKFLNFIYFRHCNARLQKPHNPLSSLVSTLTDSSNMVTILAKSAEAYKRYSWVGTIRALTLMDSARVELDFEWLIVKKSVSQVVSGVQTKKFGLNLNISSREAHCRKPRPSNVSFSLDTH